MSMCHDATTRALIEFHKLSGAGTNSSMSGQSKKSYWQAFGYAGDSIHEAFFHLGSVPLESTVADALEYYMCKLSWPLGSRLWCLTVCLLLSHWYPGPGVVLDCIDSWSLPSFLLCISQSLILFDSKRWGGGCFGEKKAELQELPLPRAVFLESVKRAQYQWIICKTSLVINPDKSRPDNYG